jgi:hypothetical protein
LQTALIAVEVSHLVINICLKAFDENGDRFSRSHNTPPPLSEAIGPAIQRKARSMLKSWSDGHSQDGAREHLLKRFKCKIRPRLRWPNEFTANKDKKRSFFGVTEAFGGL